MKINVLRNQLFSKLRVIGRVVKPSHQQAMYASFLIKTISEKEILITGCDETGRIESTLECKIDNFEEVEFLVDAKTLTDGLKELPEVPLVISLIKGVTMEVKYPVGKFEIAITDASAYPAPFKSDKNVEFAIQHSILMKGFKTVSKFASTDELRPIMQNINLSYKSNCLTFAGSNGHVLAIHEEKEIAPALPDFIVNIPSKVTKVISDIAPAGSNEEIPISYNRNNITFKIEGYTIIYRLFEGTYPNFRSVIPKDSTILVEVNRADLISAISRVSVFADESSSMIVFKTEQNTLILKSEDLDLTRGATESLMLNQIHDDFTIGFKSSFLSEILKTIEEDVCVINLSSPSRAAVLRPQKSDSTTFILMPMQVNN